MTSSQIIQIIALVGIIGLIVFFKLFFKICSLAKKDDIAFDREQAEYRKARLPPLNKSPDQYTTEESLAISADWIYRCKLRKSKNKKRYYKISSLFVLFIIIPTYIFSIIYLMLITHVINIEQNPYYTKRVDYECKYQFHDLGYDQEEHYRSKSNPDLLEDYPNDFYKYFYEYCIEDPKVYCTFDDENSYIPEVRCYKIKKRRYDILAYKLIKSFPYNQVIEINPAPDIDYSKLR